MSQRGRRSMRESKRQRVESDEESSDAGDPEVPDVSENLPLAGRVIRYLLTVQRHKVAVTAAQIKKAVLPNNAQEFRNILPLVRDNLTKIFGYRLAEIKGKFFLVNQYQNPYLGPSTPEATAEFILLHIILAFIFLQTNNEHKALATEGELLGFLRSLDILNDGEHIYFGNVRQHILNFVNQMYLSRVKLDENGQIGFEWGPRADAETDRRAVLQFISKVWDDRPIQSWPFAYAATRKYEMEVGRH